MDKVRHQLLFTQSEELQYRYMYKISKKGWLLADSYLKKSAIASRKDLLSLTDTNTNQYLA